MREESPAPPNRGVCSGTQPDETRQDRIEGAAWACSGPPGRAGAAGRPPVQLCPTPGSALSPDNLDTGFASENLTLYSVHS